MSSFGALFIGDIAFVATDTLTCLREPLEKDGHLLPDTLSSLTSKAIYIPHIQTLVVCMGSGLLSQRYHDFIDLNRSISCLDHLLLSTEDSLCKTMFSDDEVAQLTFDDNPDFLGVIILVGVSNMEIDLLKKTVKYRYRPKLVAYKLTVYKNRIEKSVLNPMGDGVTHCFHPPLPGSLTNEIFNRHTDLLKKNVYAGSEAILLDWMTAAHDQYHSSGRQTMVAGGEVNIAIFNYSGNLLVTQYTPHRFADFDENVKEMIDYRKGTR